MSEQAGDAAVRAVVREVLRDVVPALLAELDSRSVGVPAPGGAAAGGASRVNGGPPAFLGGSAAQVEPVTLRNDADLSAFVSRLLVMFDNPKRREEIRTGRLRFRLGAPATPASFQPSRRVEEGAVTEKVVREAAQVGARLVLGPGAVLTPLARDRARADGVPVERES
jgi:hypothetical protein